MSSIDIYAVLEKFQRDWDHIDSAVQVIDSIVAHLREAEQTGYLGTLYRTDFEVEGTGAFPIDMLRYTNAWPKGPRARVIRVRSRTRLTARAVTRSRYRSTTAIPSRTSRPFAGSRSFAGTSCA